jgi:hypothetical protein
MIVFSKQKRVPLECKPFHYGRKVSRRLRAGIWHAVETLSFALETGL